MSDEPELICQIELLEMRLRDLRARSNALKDKPRKTHPSRRVLDRQAREMKVQVTALRGRLNPRPRLRPHVIA